MTAPAASLSVDITANLAKLYEGLTQATGAVNRSADLMTAQFEKVNAGVAGLVSTFSTLGGVIHGIAGALGVGAFAGLISGAIEGEAELYRLSQRTGATVEGLSAMRVAAKLSGVDLEQVAIGAQRFAKNIVEAQSGTGKVAKALQDLGFNAKTFTTQFKTTDEQLFAVSKRFNEFADGTTKTASAMTLAGRSGAQLIPFFRVLGETGLSNVKVTQAQAKAAEELDKSITRLGGQFRSIFLGIANTVIPIMQALIDNMGAVKEFALQAAVVFIGLPLAFNAAAGAIALMSSAWVAYKEAAIGAALANEVLGASSSVFGVLGANILTSIKSLVTMKFLLVSLPALAFTAFASFKIGDWLQANVIDVKLFGIEMVEVFLVSWENIKYAGQVAVEALKFAWFSVVDAMKIAFGGFLELVGKGLENVPFAQGVAAQVQAFGLSLQTGGTAVADFKKNMAALDAENEKAKKGIRDITGDLKTYAILQSDIFKAKPKGAELPQLPHTAEVAALRDMTLAWNAYEEAVAAAQKVRDVSAASVATEGIKIEQAILEQAYKEGLLEFHDYYNQRIALQRQAQEVQEDLLRKEVATQEALVTKYYDNLKSLEDTAPSFGKGGTFKDQAEYQKALLKAAAEMIKADADLTKLQDALNISVQKGTQIGNDYLEYLIKANQGVLVGVRALDDQIKAAERENDAIGLTRDAVILLNVARIEAIRLRELDSGPVQEKVLNALDNEIARTKQLAATVAQGIDKQKWVTAWSDLFRSAADAGAKFLEDFAQHGTSAFKRLWDDFKKWALEAIAKIAAQQIVLSIVGQVSPGLSGIASNALQGSGGSIGEILKQILGGGGGGGSGAGGFAPGENPTSFIGTASSIGNLFSGLGSFAGGAGSGILGSVGASFSNLGLAFTAGVDSIGGFGAALGAALPALGVVAGIGVAAYGVYQYLQSKKGGPKEGGFSDTGTSVSSYFASEETPGGNAAVKTLTTALSTAFQDALKRLGGKGVAEFALGFDTDPRGKAPSNVHGTALIGGQSILDLKNPNVGRSDAELQAELKLQTQRLLLAALQNSELPDAISNVLNSVIAATASDVDISSILGVADEVKNIIDSATATLSPEKVAAITNALATVDFSASANKLKTVLSTALEQLDPTLSTLVDNFSGTDDEIKKFGNTLFSIYGAVDKIAAVKFPTTEEATGWLKDLRTNLTNYVPGAGLSTEPGHITAQGVPGTGGTPPEVSEYQKAIDAILDGTQETADKVLVFVQAILAFGDSITGVSAKLYSLDPQYITAFIDALGGAEKAAQSFNYLQANFTTGAQKTEQATAALAAQFASLGLAVPASHQAFLDLLNSFDLTTEAGRALYASVLALAPAFVQVAGTADEAAKALQSAADFFAQNFYSDAEKSAKTYTDALAQVDAAQVTLGIEIPHTAEGFRKLIEGIDRTTPAGEALYEALIVLAPEVLTVSKGITGLADSAKVAGAAIIAVATSLGDIGGSIDPTGADAAQKFMDQIKALADTIPNATFGQKLTFRVHAIADELKELQDKMNALDPADYAGREAYTLLIARLSYGNSQLVTELARFTVLTAQYGDATAEQLLGLEEWYDDQKKLFNGNDTALKALADVFKQRWDAIIAGTSTGVDGAINELERLRKSIADYLKSLVLSDLSPLTPAQKLAEAQKQYQDELAKAAAGDPAALADITKYADAYLKQARDFYASSAAYSDIFKQITDALAALAGTTSTGEPIRVVPIIPGGAPGPEQIGPSGTGALTPNDVLALSLPVSGQRIVSSDDLNFAVKALSKVINEAIGALADANTEDSKELQGELQQLNSSILDVNGRVLK